MVHSDTSPARRSAFPEVEGFDGSAATAGGGWDRHPGDTGAGGTAGVRGHQKADADAESNAGGPREEVATAADLSAEPDQGQSDRAAKHHDSWAVPDPREHCRGRRPAGDARPGA